MQLWLGFFSCLALLGLGGCVYGFTAQKPTDYVNQSPEFIPARALAGRYLSEGIVYDFTGKVVARFEAEMHGQFGADGGTLKEHFIYASGREDRREWRLAFQDERHFTATASDLVGEARGVASGNTLKMTYKLRLPKEAGGHVLSVTDWMYLTDEGTILNRSQMRKFGIKVAELVAVFKHRPLSEGEFQKSVEKKYLEEAL